MAMEDHSHYTSSDLHHFISHRPPHFLSPIPPPPPQPDLFRNLHPASHDHAYHDMMMLVPRQGLPEFRADHSCSNNGGAPVGVAVDNGGSNTVVASAQANAVLGGLDGEGGFGGGDGGTGRWPRQETLTLLEIRSRLDSKFKEANQKGPLWDEISRIMFEEHGYHRSGKKCREKFENLYKYYKKTKDGKAGRQDGKHYRFFRQLEALYGETSNTFQASLHETQYGGAGITSLRFHSSAKAAGKVQELHSQKLCDSLSLSSNSSEFDTSSSEGNNLSAATLPENNDSGEKRRRRRGGWKGKIKDFIGSQMKKVIERQEAWLEKLTRKLEEKEQERLAREDEWRKEEALRIEKDLKFWAKQRAWIEARDSALMDALKKLSGGETINDISTAEAPLMAAGDDDEKMNGKKSCYHVNFESTESAMYDDQRGCSEQIKEQSQPPDSGNAAGDSVGESCFRYFMGEGDSLWENYGLKLNSGEHNQ